MITPAERAYIAEHAYVPEHLPHYVAAISGTESFVVGDFVTHVVGRQLIFVGYPLNESYDAAQMREALDEAKKRFKPASVSILVPNLQDTLNDFVPSPPDAYYRLDLSQFQIPKKTRNMLARARQEISVCIGNFGRQHNQLINDFLRTHRLDSRTRFIFQRIPEYIKCDTALVFEARNVRGDLVAFDIAEFGARRYAFYMFNFRSRKYKIPGASDLLLSRIIEYANVENKHYINLGLGINTGIAFFKKKWGATTFLEHITQIQELGSKESWQEVFDQFSRM